MAENNIIILIIVPHSACQYDTITQRRCDKRAKSSAMALLNNIQRLNSKAICILYANDNVDRRQIDMNRNISRNTSWRRNLSLVFEYLKKQNNNNIIWVIDVHSFPGYDYKTNTDVSKFGKKTKLAILDDTKYSTWHKETEALFTYLINNVDEPDIINLIRGSKNDIQDEARSFGFTSFLIEVNENKQQLQDKTLNELLMLIAKFLLKYKP